MPMVLESCSSTAYDILVYPNDMVHGPLFIGLSWGALFRFKGQKGEEKHSPFVVKI